MKHMRQTLCCIALIFLYIHGVVGESSVHTVFTTECGAYFTWQSMGMIYSHRKSGQPGPLTRIMSCTPQEWESLTEQQKTVVKTHVAPSYTHHPKTGDIYSAYNKPVAVIDWLARNNVTEDYVLIIDADMIMRSTFVPDQVGARPGRAVSAYFGYMKGVNNKLAMKHVPEVEPRKDNLAGPPGRRGDMCGGFTLMNTNDLRRVAPLWLKYTEDVRADPDAWELTGDAFTKNPGDKPWISEMYGYSYACSKSNVWHIVDHSAMLYPGYETSEPPKVLHYGLYWDVAGTEYKFDKHWHYDFDPFKCPPWDLSPTATRETKGGLFPHPPRASSFTTTGFQLLRDLLAIEVPVTLNQAFCEHHRKFCPASEELERECSLVDEYGAELERALAHIENNLPDPCQNLEPRCKRWAKEGECEKNAGYMVATCPLACKICKPREERKKKSGSGKEPVLNDVDDASDDNSGSSSGDGVVRGTVTADQVDEILKKNSDNNNNAWNENEEERQQKLEDSEGELEVEDRVLDENDQTAPDLTNNNNDINNDVNSIGDNNNTIDDDDDGRDIDVDSGLRIPELKLRCTRFPRWTADQVKRCMTLAQEGVAYDPSIDDPDMNVSAADLHAQAHRLIDRTHDVGRLLGEGLSNVRLGERAERATAAAHDAAERVGVWGIVGWGGGGIAVVVLLVQMSRRRRNGGGGMSYYGRHAYKYSRND